MEFDLESELLNVLQDSTENHRVFAKRNAELLVFRQVQLGQTIPDLVIIRRRRGRRSKDIKLTSFESWIVGELIRTRVLHEATITRKVYALQPHVHAALKKLRRKGMIGQTPTGAYELVADFSTRFEVLSIEAKLTKWREAIDQAKTYLRFSDLSYIALPASVVQRNGKIVDACRAARVGLVAVSETVVKIVLHPENARRTRDPREWTWLIAKTGSLRV